ncbi:DUF397 domain-containing protein [Nocardia farcinica]|uniref:DUF397 domain-containing protein n=1 Tax=Nocardia farcinica TaxID=37329 RepID=UPI002454DAE7|nr:DUF397 domain-containing protein [Nocardia farcinica]
MSTDLSGAHWFKSTFSQGGGECVEIAHLDNGGVGVRDSKNPSGPVLTFTLAEWDAFLAGVRDGQFDRP